MIKYSTACTMYMYIITRRKSRPDVEENLPVIQNMVTLINTNQESLDSKNQNLITFDAQNLC